MGRRLFGGTDLRSRALPGHCRASATWIRSPEHSPCRRGPNRSRVLDRTPHCYSLLCIVIFRCFSLLFARAGTPGKSAQSRAAQGEIRRRVQRPHCYCIVINNAAVRERRAGRALPLRARCWPASSPGSALSSSRCQTARSAHSRQCVLLARAARDRRPSGSSPEDHFKCESS